MPDFKCISFDVDDTLWDFAHMMRCGMTVISDRMRALDDGACDHLTVDYLLARYREVAAVHNPAITLWTELRRRLFVTVLTECGIDDAESLSHDLIQHYLTIWRANVRLYPGVEETLAALQGRYPLAWTTNGNFGPEVANLTAYFDVIAMPHLIGTSKPDPAFFAYVAAEAGCALHEILHVGDSLRSDVAGAKAAGCTAVWFNPERKPNDTDHAPDHEIVALPDMLALLR